MSFYDIKSSIESKLLFGDNRETEFDLSIVIPTYNKPQALKVALLSVLYQESELKYEVIVVDNYACAELENETYKCIQDLGSNRVKYYRNVENIGMVSNWNRCFLLAKAKWALMLHTDDLLLPNTLNCIQMILNKAKETDGAFFLARKVHRYNCSESLADIYNKIYFSQGNLNKHDKTIEMVHPFSLIDHLFGTIVYAPTGLLLNKTIFEDLGGFESSVKPSAIDVDFLIRLLKKYNAYYFNNLCVVKREGDNDTETSNNQYRIDWVTSIYFLYNELFFNKNWFVAYLLRMRMLCIYDWARLSEKDLVQTSIPAAYREFSGLKRKIYSILKQVYRKFIFLKRKWK
jgi:glycosyltransferase involved in cell wall biosynthesis